MSVLWAKRGWMSGGTFVPHQLFASGAQGAWYDPSDFSTLFQNSTGTTPVTAVEQPVRLMLDRSRGLVLGSELATASSVTGDPIGGPSFTDYPVTGILTQNRWYRVSYTVSGYSGSNTVNISVSDLNFEPNIPNTALSGNGTVTFVGFWVASGEPLQLFTRSTNTCNFTNISVRELPGNHALAPNDASRPVLRARYNQLTFSEQFDNAIWSLDNSGAGSTNPVVTANYGVAPDGTTTADRIQFTREANGFSRIMQGQGVAVPAATYTYSVWLRNTSGSGASVSLRLDATDGPMITLTEAWQRVSLTASYAGGALASQILIYYNISGSPLTADILAWGAQLLTAADAAATGNAYQRVAAATDYDVSNPVFRPYLAFDGTDDSFSTSAIDFSGTDEMTVFAGVTKLSDAARGMLVELSASYGNPGTFGVEVPTTPATADYGFISGGSVPAGGYAVASGFAAPITNVLTAIGDISADVTSLRLNGVAAATNTDNQGTGNYSNAALFIGRRNNSSNPLNGRVYSLAVLGRTATVAELNAMEAWVNGKTGAY